ncbi:hypothetical protein J3A83DRAFT_4187386 [Scleroderma citrinum]
MASFQIPADYSNPYHYMAPIHAQQQQFYQHTPMLPPGKNDLEILENLKTIIKEGQHEFYRAVPQPAALASLYLGTLPPHSQGQPHPEQVPSGDYRAPRFNQSTHDDPSDTSLGPSNKTSADTASETPTALSAGPTQLDASSKLGNSDSRSLKPTADHPEDGKITMDRASRGPANSNHHNIKTDLPSSNAEREGEYTGTHPPVTSPVKNLYDAKDDSRLLKDNSWSHRDAPLEDKSGRCDDRHTYPPDRSFDNRGNGNDNRLPPGDRAFLDRDRDRDREHDRDRGRDWERDRDRPRDRRSDFFPRSYGRSHAPRPPPELRHYEPDYSSDYFPRRYDSRDMDLDRRGGYRSGSYDDRRPPVDDRRAPPIDDRPSRVSHPAVDDRNQGRSFDDRPTKPPSEDRSVRPIVSSDDTVPVVRTGLDERLSRLSTVGDDRGPRAPPSAEPRPPRPSVSLEERISQPVPSLQDRLSQSVPPRVENRVGRQPSLEERLSLAPVPTAAATMVTTPSTTTDRTLPDDRSARSGTVDAPHTTAPNDRPADTRISLDDRFSMPVTPPLPRQSTYPPPAREKSVARDDSRVPPSSKDNLPPIDRSDVRDFRANRELSHEKPAPPYRSDLDRPFSDDRSKTMMDVDAPSRFPDARGGLPPRRFSPPPPSDRGRVYYPPRSPPPPPRDAFHTGERRYTPADRDAFDRRRDWYGASSPAAGGGVEDDKRQAWRYDRPPIDRDNRDRFNHGRNTWDERDHERDRERERERDRERERGRRFPSPPPRSLSSRLTDPYPSPALGADDRSYLPPASARDFERSRYTAGDTSPPPFSRVRGRSPSPPRRPGIDDLRPPMKRLRDDAPPAYGSGSGVTSTGTAHTRNTTYSPERRSSVAGDYVSRSTIGSPPPSSANITNNNFYDSRGPPPFSGRGDREYGGSGGTYGSTFERGGRRSPPPSSRMPHPYGRATYPRGHDPRDDRRYIPPPPPRAA